MDALKGYNSDKEARKEKVLVALTGGIDSLVAAYLLKIQKYDLVAATVLNAWESFPGSQESVLSCHVDAPRITKIKEFCHNLSIPHYMLKSTDEFSQRVVEKWTASKLSGTKSTACWSCHDLRMKILYEKMQEIGAKFLATGHYAKVFRHESHGTVYVHSSNDEAFDQSAMLGRLPHEILDHLLLPLSDLQRKEVLKLAENFGIVDLPKKVQLHKCFENNKEVISYLETQVPAKFREGGLILSAKTSEELGNHQGILHYQLGEEVSDIRVGSEQLLKRYGFVSHNMEASSKEGFLKSEIQLLQCRIAEETHLEKPFQGIIKFSNNETSDCWVYPKNFNAFHVVWDEKKKILEGEIVSIYRKRGKNAKIFLSGAARYLPEKIQEGEDDSEKVDYTSDL